MGDRNISIADYLAYDEAVRQQLARRRAGIVVARLSAGELRLAQRRMIPRATRSRFGLSEIRRDMFWQFPQSGGSFPVPAELAPGGGREQVPLGYNEKFSSCIDGRPFEKTSCWATRIHAVPHLTIGRWGCPLIDVSRRRGARFVRGRAGGWFSIWREQLYR